jgi:hypothetical protein
VHIYAIIGKSKRLTSIRLFLLFQMTENVEQVFRLHFLRVLITFSTTYLNSSTTYHIFTAVFTCFKNSKIVLWSHPLGGGGAPPTLRAGE